MQIPELPLKSSDLHPRFQRAKGPAAAATNDGKEEEDAEQPFESTAHDDETLLEPDVFRFSSTTGELPPPTPDDLPGSKLSMSQALAHAAHHALTEQYLAEEGENLIEAELADIEELWETNPETRKTVAGRMQIVNLLNPVYPRPATLPIPTFLPSDGAPISRLVLAAQRDRHCAVTHVHSEKARKPQTDVRYLGGKFSLNHAAHQLKKDIQQNEGTRTKNVEWNIGCKLHVALGTIAVRNVKTRGITVITPLRIDSFVLMRSALRIYLGKILGIYRYGSVSGKYESFTDAETVEGLSYLSLEVYEQLPKAHHHMTSLCSRTLRYRNWSIHSPGPASVHSGKNSSPRRVGAAVTRQWTRRSEIGDLRLHALWALATAYEYTWVGKGIGLSACAYIVLVTAERLLDAAVTRRHAAVGGGPA
ncbi:hypothetical protein B0H14DRAFT_2581964 [Mycena olivaceomarginata]|nr:hypothetical protein B0H14DRAFT_2581964 [Mycena olivaceomarginata]